MTTINDLDNIHALVFVEAEKNEKQINEELVARVRTLIGPIASFRTAAAVKALPRTRSGKIIRKSIANLARSMLVKVRNIYGLRVRKLIIENTRWKMNFPFSYGEQEYKLFFAIFQENY